MDKQVFDSPTTYRGKERKRVYSFGIDNKDAKNTALRDFNADRRRRLMSNEEEIKPYVHRGNSVEYWLRFERLTILRFGI